MYNLTRSQVEQLGHETAYLGTREDERAVAYCLNSFYLSMPNEDESLTPAILEHGFWEAWITSWVTRWLRPGMTFLDVGANCGYYTLLAQELVGEYGNVVAFEANPAYIPFLEDTYAINRRSHFDIVNAAVTDKVGEIKLNIPAKLYGSASTVDDFPAYETKAVKVPAVTLDSLDIPAGPRIIKIDVEGAEEAVFNGAHKLLHDKHHTTLLMEWTPGAYTKDFLPSLQRWGDVRLVNFDGSEERPDNLNQYLLELSDWCTLAVRQR